MNLATAKFWVNLKQWSGNIGLGEKWNNGLENERLGEKWNNGLKWLGEKWNNGLKQRIRWKMKQRNVGSMTWTKDFKWWRHLAILSNISMFDKKWIKPLEGRKKESLKDSHIKKNIYICFLPGGKQAMLTLFEMEAGFFNWRSAKSLSWGEIL